MKIVLIIGIMLISSVSLAQVQKVKTGDKKALRQGTKVVRAEAVDVKVKPMETELILFGDYVIDSYSVIDKKLMKKKERKALIGTGVQIDLVDLTGDQIKPLSFEILEVENMTKEDYMFRVFGDKSDLDLSELPAKLRVHKTDQSACYGIVELHDSKVVIPYKGLLLFLSKKK